MSVEVMTSTPARIGFKATGQSFFLIGRQPGDLDAHYL
jgi:hypothetical protein